MKLLLNTITRIEKLKKIKILQLNRYLIYASLGIYNNWIMETLVKENNFGKAGFLQPKEHHPEPFCALSF